MKYLVLRRLATTTTRLVAPERFVHRATSAFLDTVGGLDRELTVPEIFKAYKSATRSERGEFEQVHGSKCVERLGELRRRSRLRVGSEE